MGCVTQCGCAYPMGVLAGLKKKNHYIDCETDDYYFDVTANKATTANSYTIPRSGYYVAYINSHGADITETMIYYPQGTNTIVDYYEKGDVINYVLGSNSKIQNKRGEWVEAGSLNNSSGAEVYRAGIVFQYLGQISEPVLILTDEGFREGVSSFGRFLQGTNFEGQPRVIEPQLSDIVYNSTGNNTFSFFAVTKFTVPESKNYIIGASGDDYANVYIDSKPALWLAKNNPNRNLLLDNKFNSSYNQNLTNSVYLTAGEHTLVFWNCSPICCNISGIVAVKDPDTNIVYAYDTEYKYIRSEVNCLFGIQRPKFKFKADNEYDQSTTVIH